MRRYNNITFKSDMSVSDIGFTFSTHNESMSNNIDSEIASEEEEDSFKTREAIISDEVEEIEEDLN